VKQALLQALLVLAATGVDTGASAQATSGGSAYPTKPIRFVVPFAPGGTPDIQVRMLADPLRERLGQPVVIDNRAGANGIIGMEIVARAPADGYTVIIATVGNWAVHPHLFKLPYDVWKDFTPIIHVATTPGVLVVHPSVPAMTVKELIALARKRPGDLNY
jgi:tripartite-type tricarboxylate transporter receptor subunit TctC